MFTLSKRHTIIQVRGLLSAQNCCSKVIRKLSSRETIARWSLCPRQLGQAGRRDWRWLDRPERVEVGSDAASDTSRPVGSLGVSGPTATVLTTVRHARSRLLLVSLGYRRTDSSTRLPLSRLQTRWLRLNSIAYKQHGLINALPTLYYYAIS